ncbi:hypothetical protein [Variovorax sp. KK3]|uniref:hypothetical protein n=1 Tax=Variovorax sp. KK3 TaxID=1855728 RepID=UPI00097C82F9|nr:hypothetical protein [Variovorax sp. KK3]
MIRRDRSRAAENPELTALKRGDAEDNLAWGERAVAQMQTGDQTQWTYVVLLGGDDMMAFRLRLAQSHLRRDMLPSFWSDAMLVKLVRPSLKGATAIHVPLIQPGPPAFSTKVNGVVEVPIGRFKDATRFPNIAVIALPTPQAQILERIEDFKRSRSTLDALEHVIRWLAFSWGAARTPNPLHENYGIPSACMLEIACAAAQFDLTPGLESRASCPEAIWAAARHWQDYYKKTTEGNRFPQGRYWTPHRYPIFEPDAPPARKGGP